MLNINVASKQQQGERRDQSGVPQVDLGVPHLRRNREQSRLKFEGIGRTHVHCPSVPSPGTAASRASAGAG